MLVARWKVALYSLPSPPNCFLHFLYFVTATFASAPACLLPNSCIATWQKSTLRLCRPNSHCSCVSLSVSDQFCLVMSSNRFITFVVPVVGFFPLSPSLPHSCLVSLVGLDLTIQSTAAFRRTSCACRCLVATSITSRLHHVAGLLVSSHFWFHQTAASRVSFIHQRPLSAWDL